MSLISSQDGDNTGQDGEYSALHHCNSIPEIINLKQESFILAYSFRNTTQLLIGSCLLYPLLSDYCLGTCG